MHSLIRNLAFSENKNFLPRVCKTPSCNKAKKKKAGNQGWQLLRKIKPHLDEL